MALTLARFLVRHEEFATVADPVVQTYIDDALRRTPADVWGDDQEAAAAWLAAHLIEVSPYGRDARLDEDGLTTYEKVRTTMELEVAPGAFCRVT